MRLTVIQSLAFVTLSTIAGAQQHWSLRAVESVEPPTIEGDQWSHSPIDQFVIATLSEQGLSPVGDGEPETLVRRIFYNLIGLPPREQEVDAFLDHAEQDLDSAIEQLVDDLLLSPHFGEKWGRHWLDLARYAESNGKDRDVVFPEAWRYRDYVIDSFNDNKPYDEFVFEQIAGDLMVNRTDNSLIATGFLALGPKAFQEVNNERFAMDVVDEQIDVMTRSILGLTVACARCHDHKYDPISTEDYYAMAGILLSSDTHYGPGPLYFGRHDKDTSLVPFGEKAEELDPIVQQWRSEILSLTEKVTGLRSSAYRIQRKIAGALRERGLKKATEAKDLAEDEKKMLQMRADANAANEKRLNLIEATPQQRPGYAMAVLRSETPPEDCAVRFGGVHTDRGDRVPRGAMKIPGMPDFGTVAAEDSGRRQLAHWLASPKNPLTARVFVNRVWHHLFGTGLVRSVDNFGITGQTPSHPQLLDYLAHQFMDDDWNTKRLIRRIVLSRTWRLASLSDGKRQEVDPENRWLWRANYRRLSVEAFRDSVLAVSGVLDRSPPEGSLFQEVYAGKDYGEPNPHRVNFDKEIADDVHRTVYLPLARNSMPEFLALFDFADPNTTTGARNSRTIPAQALYLMNSEFMETRSRQAAERILQLPEPERITAAWRRTTGTGPSDTIASETRKWLSVRGAESSELEAWTDVMQALLSSAAFRYVQ